MHRKQEREPARRDILRGLAGLLPATLLAGAAQSPANPAPSINFPTDGRARLSVTSYPFRSLIKSPSNREQTGGAASMDMTEFPAFVAEHFQVYNVNPLLAHFASTEPSYLESFRAALGKAKSHIVDLGLGGKQFYAADPAIRSAAVTFGKKSIDCAALLGSPSVRQHVEGDKTRNVELAAESLGQLAEYGEKHNVVVNLENDDPVAEDPFFLLAVIEKVKSPYLRALPDFGNTLLAHDAAFNQKAVAAMLPLAFNMCHVKDVVSGHTGQMQTVDLAQMFALAKRQNFRGYFSMEYETKAGDPISGTKHLVDESLKYLS
jgi:sugar phosphate isomerase/epimerase